MRRIEPNVVRTLNGVGRRPRRRARPAGGRTRTRRSRPPRAFRPAPIGRRVVEAATAAAARAVERTRCASRLSTLRDVVDFVVVVIFFNVLGLRRATDRNLTTVVYALGTFPRAFSTCFTVEHAAFDKHRDNGKPVDRQPINTTVYPNASICHLGHDTINVYVRVKCEVT